MKTNFTTILSILFILITASLSAKNIYVDAAVQNGNGVSWSTAHNDLNPALSAAVPGDVIHVKNGTYKPGTDRTSTFRIPAGVTILGGYDTNGNRFPKTTETILSGEIGGVQTTDNVYNVVTIIDLSSVVVLDGIIVEKGYANGSSNKWKTGGGIHISTDPISNTIQNSAIPQLKNMVLRDNHAEKTGGGLYCVAHGLNIDGSLFQNNASVSGGGFYVSGLRGLTMNLDVTKTIFKYNHALKGNGFFSSATNTSADILVSDCLFKENTTTNFGDPNSTGGAFYIFAKQKIDWYDNLNGVTSSYAESKVEIVNSIFTENTAYSAGAAYSLVSSDNNTATVIETIDIINCTFYKNTAQRGGAIYLNESKGVNGGNPTGIVNVKNSILWENQSLTDALTHELALSASDNGGDPEIYTYNTLYSKAVDCNSFITGVTCDGSNIFYNTTSPFVDGDNCNFALTSTSVAIDAGSNGYVPTNTLTDYNDSPRIHGTVDLGAIESTLGALPVELLQFTGHQKDEHIILEWSTASELNNAYFLIERSVDGQNYELIDKVLGNGTTLVAHEYNSYDNNPVDGVNYYRLKQVDFNGDFEYSKIIAVNYTGNEFQIYPNPNLGNVLYLKNKDYDNNQLEYHISTTDGKVVLSGNILFENGSASIDLAQIANLNAATYFLSLTNGAKSTIVKKINILRP